MSFTYSFTDAPVLSRVRLLTADTNPDKPLFDDDEVNAALTMESSQNLYVSGMATLGGAAPIPPVQVYSVYRAAALLLDALASNKSKLAAIAELLDVHVSAEKAAQELRNTAKEYRAVEQNNGSFAIAELVYDQFSARERIRNQLLRQYGSS